jgi:hypothetical protein
MKRFLSFLALTLWPIWRAPAWAQLTTLGAGGVAAVIISNLVTPSIVPQISSYFNANQATGDTNNALAPNNGVAGAFELPSVTNNSHVVYIEGSIDASLAYNTFESETAISNGAIASGLTVSGNAAGQPAFTVSRNAGGGAPGSQWWNAVSSNLNGSSASQSTGTGYFSGYYPFTATGGNCAREPTGVWLPGVGARIVDPGFLCGFPPTVDVSLIPGDGAQQSTGAGGSATTCVSNSPVTGQVTVTTHLAVAHGLVAGQTFPLSGFTPTALNLSTYVALPSPNSTTLVGTAAMAGGSPGTCPSLVGLVEGKALAGINGSITMVPITTTNPFGIGETGITTKTSQHFCGLVGEYGSDSSFPGAQFASFVDDKGNALPGAPALVPWLNQGTENFTGFISFGTQSPASPALTVTALTPYTVTSWAYSGSTGFVTFTMDATAGLTGFIPGSEFTVTGGGGVAGKTYVVVAQAGVTYPGLTIVANPLSGPVGTPLANNPGASGTGGSMASVIMPNMQIIGSTANLTGSVIAPFGQFGGTGVGGLGTYALVNNPSTGTLTGRIDNGTLGSGIAGTTLTTSGATASPPIVVGTAISGTGVSAGTVVTAVLSASTFTVNNSQLVATAEAMVNAGTIGSAGAPVNMWAFPVFYFTGVVGTTAAQPWGGIATPRTQASYGDFFNIIGSTSLLTGAGRIGWGGALANVSMLWGAFPQATGGAPDTTKLASLCKKTTDLQSFAAANSLTVHSLYRLDDPGIFADSSAAKIKGYITGASGATATLNVSSTQYGALTGAGTVTIAGPGIPGCPLACPTAALGSGPTYTLTWGSSIAANVGSSGSPVAMAAGAFKPATPIASGSFNGYIDNGSGSTPTLHVTSIPPVASFTATLGNTVTGNIPIGNTLNVTANANTGYAAIAVGSTITGAGVCTPTCPTVTAMSSTTFGLVGSYTLSQSYGTAVASEAMFASGVLPAVASSLMVNAVASGTIAGEMIVTDGGVNITGDPLFLSSSGPTVNGLATWVINQTYTPPFANDATMVGVTTTMVPGQYILGAGITTPVSIIGYGTGVGEVGTYLLSNASSNGVGSSGSPVALTSTGIGDAGAVAPGPALTIKDLGAGVTFPVTNFSAGTGNLTLSGTFDTSVLDTSGHNTAPTAIQAQVSLTAGGPPVPGCSACAWTNLSGYSATLPSGTLFDWKGQALNIPASAGPLFVSVRAANGTAYATMPSLIKVGLVFDISAEGQASALGIFGGTANSYFTGLWGQNAWSGAGAGALDQGPPVLGPWVPAQTIMYAGDRFSILGGGIPVAEGTTVLQQKLTNAFGWPVTQNQSTRDGIGISPETMGNVFQAQTVGLGDGSSSTFCSASKFCGPTSSPAGVVSGGGPLVFTGATQTGSHITASITGGTLSVTNVLIGALQPGAVVSDTTGAIVGSPTLVNCLTGCAPTVGPPSVVNNVQTWTISVNQATPVSSETMQANLGTPPWPGYNIQGPSLSFVNGGFGTEWIQAGTFKITVNGTVVCQDSSVFAYNVQGGNCTDSGSHVVSSGWVNYTTGDYGITFSSPPASNAVITASWTNIISPDGNQTPATNRPLAVDFFGNGNPQSGPFSSIFAKTPGGSSGHIFAGGISDEAVIVNMGYPLGAVGYTQTVSWLYSTKFPNVLPGQSASTPFICANYWRSEGPDFLSAGGGVNNSNQSALFEQWAEDMCAPSTFSGFIASSVLTLTSAVTGSNWEGEIVGGPGVTPGTFILDLKTGTWGANGSTYDLGGSPADVGSSGSPVAMKNAVFYLGPGPAFYAGPMNDVAVQSNGGLAGTTGLSPHPWNGFAGGRRVASRWAAEIWGGLKNLTANLPVPPLASDPTLDRVKADASGCDTSALAAPCFDIGNTFAASHSATIAAAQITVTGGIAAHTRPFVVGQLLACSGCTTGRFITSIDVPPTQSTTTGAGEVGQTFHITANGSLLTGPTTETVTAGCSGTSGVGSNCIDLTISINTTNGNYATAAALATCGENNLNGAAPNYQPPNGICQTNGIGSLVRNFRIGVTQSMRSGTATGSPYDDGVDFGANFNQSAAFTCNIVSAKVVQCVKGVSYASGIVSSIGQWASGSTFMEYGDSVNGTGRIASFLGNVGGQSFPFTPGSGYTNGTFKATAACTSLASGGVLPAVDVTVSGGSIVNVYGSSAAGSIGLGIGGGCTFALPAGMGAGSGTAAIGTPVVAPTDGFDGIATYNTDSNMMGDLLYDNSGLPGNPLNSFFTNGLGGYFEPGLPVHPWGEFLGAAVSG